MFVALFIGLVVLLIIVDYLNRRRHNEIFKQNGIKSFTYLPIIGSAHHLVNVSPNDLLQFTSEVFEKYGNTCSLWLLNRATILTADPVVLEPLLSSQKVLKKNSLYGLLDSWLKEGLLLSTGPKWHSRRKTITPTFHFKILEEFVQVFEEQSNIMMDALKEKADGETVVNLYPFVCAMALDIIAVSAIFAERFIAPLQRFDFWLRLTAPRRFQQLQSNIALMHDFTGSVIEQRRAQLEQSIENNTRKDEATDTPLDDDVGRKKHSAFLDMLLQAKIKGQPLSNSDIREEVDTFMFEGHDTTTSGISFTCYLLSRHPAVQQKVFEELRAVIGDDKQRAMTLYDLQALQYLECVIKESMRLYPPVPTIGRHIEEDVYLGDKLFPANTNITILIYHAMRNSDYFDDAEQFIPERFSADADRKINTFAYVPFSAGPRNCVGQKFAMLEMKSTICKILRHYELLALGQEVRPIANIVLLSANGVNMGLRPRKYV